MGQYGYVTGLKGNQVHTRLDNGEVKIFVNDADPVIERIWIDVQSHVTILGQPDLRGLVVAPAPSDEPRWVVDFPGGSRRIVAERGLRPAVVTDPLERMKAGLLGKARDFNLRSVAADIWNHHLHNELVALDHARVDLLPHQVGVVHRVINHYPHRFLLADEVGLGKTIEAAMIVKELRARKQVRRVLVLVPSGLQRQWQFELKTKFNETFAIYNSQTIAHLRQQGVKYPWVENDCVITSHSWASWSPERRSEIASVDWDMVVVDEAHHAREQRSGNRVSRTNLYRLVRDLTSGPDQRNRAVLFLTATPMQLQHHELYSLVEMLDPVLFASEPDFAAHLRERSGLSRLVERIEKDGLPDEDDEAGRRELVDDLAGFLGWDRALAYDKIATLGPDSLVGDLRSAHRLSDVLVRNRRALVGGFQPRMAVRWPVELTDLEREVHDDIQRFLRTGFAEAAAQRSNSLGFLMTIYQKMAASSTNALVHSLRRPPKKEANVDEAEEALDGDQQAADVAASIKGGLDWELKQRLADQLERIPLDSKAKVLAAKLFELFGEEPDGKVLIFTQFRETQAMLAGLLRGSGWGVHLFHGQLSPLEKDDAVAAFRDETGPQILVSTEAGGEGRNLQFCRFLVNYDLPWNPMKVEQRIGRVDRIGQDRPVVVFNLYVEDSIEERVLDVLERRIGLFEDAIGGLEPILGEVETDLRAALKLADAERDQRLADLASRTESKVRAARNAAEQLGDFVLDTRSFGSEIAQMVRAEESPVTQADYERFLVHLLKSVGTWIDRPDEKGIYRVMFHAPFAIEQAELLHGVDKRRVCFDPKVDVDSELVEYMGFGHPIIDHLVGRTIGNDFVEGMAAVRRVEGQSGWQFNFLLEVGGLNPYATVLPVFVGDDGTAARDVGDELLLRSRQFSREEGPSEIDGEELVAAHASAQIEALQVADRLEAAAASGAEERADAERSKVGAWHAVRRQAAEDKVAATRETHGRLMASSRSEDQAVVPLWEANLRRAEHELEEVDADRDERLADLQAKLSPATGVELLGCARVADVGSFG